MQHWKERRLKAIHGENEGVDQSVLTAAKQPTLPPALSGVTVYHSKRLVRPATLAILGTAMKQHIEQVSLQG
jgi:hypothetical protein